MKIKEQTRKLGN